MIKKYFSLFIFLFIPTLINAEIMDDHYIPTPTVVEIFRTFSPIFDEEQNRVLENPTLEGLNGIAQKVFLRPAGTERKDLSRDASRFASVDMNHAHALFRELHDIGDVEPKYPSYAYILLNGSTVTNMQERLNSLIRFINEGKIILTSDTKVVFLTGERDLFENEIPLVPSACKTEADAAEWIWRSATLPENLKSVNISFIRSPKMQTKDGKWVRPTTPDTVNVWMATQNPSPGTCLSISSQPFVYYQELTMKSILPFDFMVEGVGHDGYSPEKFSENIQIYLDNLARTIYTALSIKKKSGY